jgi:hypothetical protein
VSQPELLSVALESAATIDDFLGPAKFRFFGSGYREVDRQLSEVCVSAGDGRIDGYASVHFPDRWSRKGTVDQRPHLSTIDVLAIGARLSELLVTALFSFDEAIKYRIRLMNVEIRAGSVPDETGLARFPVSAVLTEVTTAPAGKAVTEAMLRSKVTCRVASMIVACTIDHPMAPRSATDRLLAAVSLDDSAFKEASCVNHTEQRLTSITKSDSLIGATLELVHPNLGNPDGGHRFTPGQSALSMVDVFVGGLQMGQVLMYQLDSVSRVQSNTLWMRRTHLCTGDVSLPFGERMPVVSSLEESSLLVTGSTTWRVATIVTTISDWSMRCAVAHALPAI